MPLVQTDYTNPLDNFQSYSYHHILMVSYTTEALRRFTAPLSPGVNDPSLAMIDSAKGLGEDLGGSVFIVCDTRRFSQFSITDVHYTSMVLAGTPHQTQLYTGNVEMTVIDTTGISLLNYLRYLIDERLKCQLFGLSWLLKTVFVGHRDDGGSEVISTSAIPMIMLDIAVDITPIRGQYTFKLTPLTQGAPAQILAFNKIYDASTLFTNNSEKVVDMVNALEQRLNQMSVKYYADFNVLSRPGDAQQATSVSNRGRLVQYMITLPDSWQEFKLRGVTSKNDETTFQRATKSEFQQWNAETGGVLKPGQTQQQAIAEWRAGKEQVAQNQQTQPPATQSPTKTTGESKSRYVATTPTMTITQALENIFKQSNDINKLANFSKRKDQTDGIVKLYKIVSSVTSDDKTFMIHFDVVEFEVPDIELKTLASPQDSRVKNRWFYYDENEKKEKPLNHIEYNYIFSGKNTHILNLDIKLTMAWETLSNVVRIGAPAAEEVGKGQKEDDKFAGKLNKQDYFLFRDKDPVMLPVKTKEEIQNFSFIPEQKDPEAGILQNRQEFLRTLADVHGRSQLDVQMTIRGNPNLLNKFIDQTILEHKKVQGALSDYVRTVNGDTTRAAIDSNQREQWRKSLENFFLRSGGFRKTASGALRVTDSLQDGPHPATGPVFVKVNIFGPNVDFVNLEPIAGQPFAQQMFYQGRYMLSKIEHHFKDGSFTQNLFLKAFDVYGAQQAGKTNPVAPTTSSTPPPSGSATSIQAAPATPHPISGATTSTRNGQTLVEQPGGAVVYFRPVNRPPPRN